MQKCVARPKKKNRLVLKYRYNNENREEEIEFDSMEFKLDTGSK
jgi:hypothetical protein